MGYTRKYNDVNMSNEMWTEDEEKDAFIIIFALTAKTRSCFTGILTNCGRKMKRKTNLIPYLLNSEDQKLFHMNFNEMWTKDEEKDNIIFALTAMTVSRWKQTLPRMWTEGQATLYTPENVENH